VGDLVETVTRGNISAVKTVLASVVLGLAAYQLVLAAVGYGKVRTPLLRPPSALWTHRFAGDAIAVLIVVVATMCISYFGSEGEDGTTLHIATGSALLGALALKIVVVRWWHSAGRVLPVLGIVVFVLIVLTWSTSAGLYL
jgi:hypothetical protein